MNIQFCYSNPNSQRFNFNGLNGGGGIYPQGGFPQGGYPQGVGGYPTAFNGPQGPIRGQYQPNLYGNGFGAGGGGNYPGIGGGNYPGIGGGNYAGIGGGHYPSGVGGNYPGNIGPIGPIGGHLGSNHGIHSGQVPVLVGPGAIDNVNY